MSIDDCKVSSDGCAAPCYDCKVLIHVHKLSSDGCKVSSDDCLVFSDVLVM